MLVLKNELEMFIFSMLWKGVRNREMTGFSKIDGTHQENHFKLFYVDRQVFKNYFNLFYGYFFFFRFYTSSGVCFITLYFSRKLSILSAFQIWCKINIFFN